MTEFAGAQENLIPQFARRTRIDVPAGGVHLAGADAACVRNIRKIVP